MIETRYVTKEYCRTPSIRGKRFKIRSDQRKGEKRFSATKAAARMVPASVRKPRWAEKDLYEGCSAESTAAPHKWVALISGPRFGRTEMTSHRSPLVIVLIAALFCSGLVVAQEVGTDNGKIYLEAAVFDPLLGPGLADSALRLSPETSTDSWIVQFRAPLTKQQREMLNAEYGLKLTSYIPNLAYLERIPKERLERLWKSELVRAIVAHAVAQTKVPIPPLKRAPIQSVAGCSATIQAITPNPATSYQLVNFSGGAVASAGCGPLTWEWSSNIDGVLSTNPVFTKSSLSVGLHTITFRGMVTCPDPITNPPNPIKHKCKDVEKLVVTQGSLTGEVFCGIEGASWDAMVVAGTANVLDERGSTNATITGTNLRDLILANGLNNKIDGHLERDCIYGYDGSDRISGSSGSDTIYGGSGGDSINGGIDDDTILGEDGADNIDGGRGADRLHGGNGNDHIDGNLNDDIILGGDGNDTIQGGSGGDTIFGDIGDDRLEGKAGADTLDGGPGRDKLKGDSGPDVLKGGSGDDFLMGDAQGDDLDGDGGDDRLCGNSGNDDLDGGGDTDTCRGGWGWDQISSCVPPTATVSQCTIAAWSSW